MIGTLVNTAAVAAGAGIGLLAGQALPERVRSSVMIALGLCTLVLGVGQALNSADLMIPVLSVVVGVVVGELLHLQDGLNLLADRVRRVVARGAEPGTFVEGLLTATLLFCVGPLTIMGATLEGMGNADGTDMLLLKSLLDFFAAMALASTFGVGVLASAAAVLLVQGSLTLLGYLVGHAVPDTYIHETAATGGIVLLGLSLVLMDVRKVPVANFLPALGFAPLVAWAWPGLRGLIGQ